MKNLSLGAELLHADKQSDGQRDIYDETNSWLFKFCEGAQKFNGADVSVYGTIRTVHTTYAAALKTTTLPKIRCRKPYAATQHLMLLMMGVCTRNMSS